ncbi:MAG TPA: ubiquinone/menaquinone biosynthesis methyltransferase [Bacteroidales bacterium]|jgi:demethylmenaquinone methyltransferase/2-methoxy-6-polyprenyl-1,4-benzoquinol methylase|nr:ubiquinone/menaquinone biosynthesis methyltransferase [Bacteroidales bacterium]MCZ2416937.1 ubiquinone/menaquinone biosynthesis methyltransferase [Burkholderiales bacterium]OQC58082.1 MAG: Ubiquinone/menaquinone biosynthesis C-methyltransferase UbiE [Bacteroidetes bacterium ADurb.Bin013]MBP9000378.1 ubiquinone/menaquinone biosynthesis methyltransferase [Bacteroidales bacterium]HOF76567.1 ubiquinone/menaquinone biosynthesis methyltransferase [Bacteroidales bacterium]
MTNPTEISARYDLTNEIFNAIAKRYDRTNTLVSLGLDRLWQRKLIREVQKVPHSTILDLACGTGTLTRKLGWLDGAQVTGLDPSESMLRVAKSRTPDGQDIIFQKGYAESLPLTDNSFQVITISYGIRNFADRNASFRHALRVLEPGGQLFILEFSEKTEKGTGMALQRFYIRRILPLLGWLSTGEKEAYGYLRDSIASFPPPQSVCGELERAGFSRVACRRLFPGIAVLYTGKKNGHDKL